MHAFSHSENAWNCFQWYYPSIWNECGIVSYLIDIDIFRNSWFNYVYSILEVVGAPHNAKTPSWVYWLGLACGFQITPPTARPPTPNPPRNNFLECNTWVQHLLLNYIWPPEICTDFSLHTLDHWSSTLALRRNTWGAAAKQSPCSSSCTNMPPAIAPWRYVTVEKWIRHVVVQLCFALITTRMPIGN